MYSVTVRTALPGNTFLFESMTGREELGRLSVYELSLLSARHDIQPADLLGQPVVVTIRLDGQLPRHIHAYVTGFSRSVETSGARRWTQYRLQAHCWLWFLTQSTDCRIFQHQSVVEIVKAMLQEPHYQGFNVRDETRDAASRKWEYAVQYRETDYNFVMRLLEQEGVYFYFDHHEQGHDMVLCDRSDEADAVSGNPVFRYATNPDQKPDHQILSSWALEQRMQPSKYVLADYNPLEKARRLTAEHYAGTHGVRRPDTEYFDYPGEFEKDADADAYARIRAEELHAGYRRYRGAGTGVNIRPGFRFQIDGGTWKQDAREFLITGATFSVVENSYETGTAVTDYACAFESISLTQVFRPARVTPKPLIHGFQTATVTGPQGSEIHTNDHLQVKVRFHWDRNMSGAPDEKSTCWIRVAQSWAGKNRGFIAVPRVGDEVVVAFEEGDPDRPLVIGSLYHDINRNRHAIRSQETRTGLVTLSSKQGGESYNEWSFEDNKGSELVYLRAEKDWETLVKHDSRLVVGNDVTQRIQHDRTTRIDNNETVHIGNNRSYEVGAAEKGKVGASRQVEVAQADALKVGTELTIKAGQSVTIEAGVTITLKAGPSTIELGPSGITIKGPIVKVN